MNVSIQIEVDGVDEALGKFERYGDLAMFTLKREGLSAGLTITAGAKALCPVWLGELKADIHMDFPETSRLGFDVEVKADAGHAAAVEYGSRPHMPPIAAVTPWALAHGFDPWALARHIARHGTRPHPFLRPAFDAERDPYLARVAEGLNVDAL